MSRLQDGPFQDKTVNELKLRFVKTWWVRWPSFVSLPPINFLCHTSWVKYREAWKWQSSTQTQISSEFSWLGRRSCHKHAGPPPRTLTHILSSSLFTYAHYCLTLRASTQPIGCFFSNCRKTLLKPHTFAEPNSSVNLPRQECTTGGWLSVSECRAFLRHTSLILNTLLYLLQSSAPVHWEEIKMSS